MSRADDLADLIRQQAHDDGRHVRVPSGTSVRAIDATSVGVSLDQIGAGDGRRRARQSRPRLNRSGPLAYRPEGHDWIYLAGIGPWSMEAIALSYLGQTPCPGCGGTPRTYAYCLICDRTGLDNRPGINWPGLPVGSVLSDDETARSYRAQPRYTGTGNLKGGR